MPNRKPNIPPESLALGRAARRTATSAPAVRVLKPERWERQEDFGLTYYTATRPAGGVLFSAEDAVAVFDWLLTQPIPSLTLVSEFVAHRDEWLDLLHDFLQQFGVITIPDPRRSDTALKDMSRALEAPIRDQYDSVAKARGLPRRPKPKPVSGQEPLSVSESDLTAELIRLSSALRIVLLIARDGADAAADQIERDIPELIQFLVEATAAQGLQLQRGQLLRFHVSSQVDLEGFHAIVIPSSGDEPARVGLMPVSAIQLLWLMLAVTIDALEPPFATPGVHRCDYCSVLFAGDRSGVRGEHTFCSPRHGKSFWARKRMQEKRQAAREEAQQQTEGGG